MILNSVWYPQYPPIDSDSFDFKSVVAWLAAQTGLPQPALVQEPYANSTLLAPAQLVFTKPGGQTQAVDAVLTYMNPNVSLTILQQVFGLPVTNAHYAPPALPVIPAPPPAPPTRLVGPAITGTPGWFYTVPGDNSPDGTETMQDGHTYLKKVVASVVGSSAYWFEIG